MTNTSEQYDLIVNSLKGQLPSLPIVMDELMTIISDPNAALYAIKDIIKLDPSIYAQVLKVVNTVQYRGDGEPRISSLGDAMQRLGLEKIKRIALNTSVLKLFENTSFSHKFSPESLWIHSVGVAVTSANLAEFLDFPMSDQAYSCGLVHDIGKLAKLKFDPTRFSEELDKANESNCDNLTAELNLNSIRHDLLGSMIAKSWGLSSLVVAATRWHHEEERPKRNEVEDTDVHKLIDIVQFSNSLINEMKFGNSGHNSKVILSERIMRRLQISDEQLDDFEEKLSIVLEQEKEHLALLSQK